MKRQRGCRFLQRFQYPRADRPLCNSTSSISGSYAAQSFQYPRADRPLCNSRHLKQLHTRRSKLSVSSCGSSPLQHWYYIQREPRIDLSVSSCGSSPLQRILLQQRLRFLALSVSSCGSSPLQLAEHASGATCGEPFSILVRIVPSATRRHRHRHRHRQRLSVSSCGSSPLQLVVQQRLHEEDLTLSVSSCGSSPLQLPRPCRLSASPAPFSILVRIVPSATLQNMQAAQLAGSFQYPRADRPLCNAAKWWQKCRLARTFSILVRIVPSATRHGHHGTCASGAFQYPRADRPLCN